MKRIKEMAIGWLLIALMIAGCGMQGQTSEQKIHVITSFYPLYDFARQIGGEHVEVTNMVPAGTDPHDWSPRSQDMIAMAKSELFVYNGAGFDDWWVDDFLDSLQEQSRPIVVKASEGIDLISTKAETDTDDAHDHGAENEDHEAAHDHGAENEDHEAAHNHEAEEDHESAHNHEAEDEDHEAAHDHGAEDEDHESAHDHETGEGEHDHAHHAHDHGIYDPHVWLSPLNAIVMAENIKNGLIAVDPDHKADYEANFVLLEEELTALHNDYIQVTAEAPRKQFVTSHEAFAYMARDYGLQQMAVMGLAGDAEPTSHDLKLIADFIAEHNVQYIMMEELASPKIAETLAADLGIEVLTLNPVEGLTKQQQSDGENYISLMRHNLQSLELALYD